MDCSYLGESKYQCQYNYAMKCFGAFEYKDLKVLARGQAIPRGTRLVSDLCEELQGRGEKVIQRCEMGFQDPTLYFNKEASKQL